MMNESEVYNRASELTKSGQINEALRLYGSLLSSQTLSNFIRSRVFNDLGKIAYSAGEVQKARLFLDKAIFSDALNEDSYRNLTSVNAKDVSNKKIFKFSVAITTYNRHLELKRCVDSIRRNSFYPAEIIIVCDPCNDGTIEYLEQEQGKGDVVVIINEYRAGAVKSWNKGLSAAAGNYICLLNDDMEVMPGWDLALVAAIDEDPEAGCGVPLVIYPDGTVQSPGQYNPYRSFTFPWIGRASYIDTAKVTGQHLINFPEFYFPRECDYGYAPVMKKECFEKVGLLDEQFEHYFIDPDLGYRVQQAGYKNIYCPTSVIMHYDLSKKDPELVRKRFEPDLNKFLAKWDLYDFCYVYF
jgi:GT2 family glycosyltransferase